MKYLYHSTRSNEKYLHDHEAILKGIADDGGLYVMDTLGDIQLDIKDLMQDSYQDLAMKVMSKLLPNFNTDDLKKGIDKAYGKQFDTEEITPMRKVGKDYILELFHGPTSAFKDVGLQMLPQLMSIALPPESIQKVMILTATSGDTGKAALEGFHDIDNIGITVFYPNHGVSAMQRLQMVTQPGKNVAVCALHGNFDDAQSQVKTLFSKQDLKEEFQSLGIQFSSANSINIGRLIPQVVYYFYAYVQMVKNKEIVNGENINFCVPTGNFGNVLAGYYAKMMGLPVHRFIVASNANNVLSDFLKDGVYDRKRPFLKTISPSMDILISSNLERLLYYMSEKDCDFISKIMQDLKDTGRYAIPDHLLKRIQEQFYGGYSSDELTRQSIQEVYERTGYVMDPHTAVGYGVMKQYQALDDRPCVLLSTASPFKFADEVYDALFQTHTQVDEFTIMQMLADKTNQRIPHNLAILQERAIHFTDCIHKEDMQTYVHDKTKEILL